MVDYRLGYDITEDARVSFNIDNIFNTEQSLDLQYFAPRTYSVLLKPLSMITGIIPARYASTRFPGKPLIDIHGKSMLQRVYEQCQNQI